MARRLFIIVCIASFGLLISSHVSTLAAAHHTAGVNYGMMADNLPPPDRVVALYKSRKITRLRLFNPDHAALRALQGSGIKVVLGTLNQDLRALGADPSSAVSWVATNVLPYAGSVSFRYITAGNEVIPGDQAASVLPAMRNLAAAVAAANLTIPVTTVVSTEVLGVSFPPSEGTFSDAAAPVMGPIAAFLGAHNYPLLVNVYPYFAYVGDTTNVRLDYALSTAGGVVVQDGAMGYRSLFEAIVDAVYSALEKVGGHRVHIVVSETGWPSGGGAVGATVANARTYNNNAAARARRKVGTPKRPKKGIETYLFAMFNERLKPAGTEQNFGLYHPDMTEVYHVDF